MGVNMILALYIDKLNLSLFKTDTGVGSGDTSVPSPMEAASKRSIPHKFNVHPATLLECTSDAGELAGLAILLLKQTLVKLMLWVYDITLSSKAIG